MRYVFGFELEYQKYKKHLRITLFFDDRMIDDITLTENSKITKFYELELDQCNQIKFEIECEDSNHTNGFITKTARYKLIETLFIPKACFNKKEHDRLQKKKRQKWHNLHERRPDWVREDGELGLKMPPDGGSPAWPQLRSFPTYHKYKNIKITGGAGLWVNESAIIKIPVKHKFKTLFQYSGGNYINFNAFTPWLNKFNESK